MHGSKDQVIIRTKYIYTTDNEKTKFISCDMQKDVHTDIRYRDGEQSASTED